MTQSLLAFYNSFLKTRLNCDEEDMLISNTRSLQKKMLTNLTCVLIYSLTKNIRENDSGNFVKLAEIYPWRSFLLRKLQYLDSPLFERSAPPNIISYMIYEIFIITNNANLTCQM